VLPTSETLIVGAGLAGCSTAWHLSQKEQVFLLDMGRKPGQEASAQNVGMVRRMGEDPCERALALRTHAFLETLPDDWSTSPSRRSGAVIGLVRDPHHLSDAAAHLQAAGVRHEVCDRPPDVAPALAGSSFNRAWYLPDERAADPAQLLSGFLKGALARGAKLRLECRVEKLLVQSGRVVGVQTPEGPIHSDRIVLATGAWSSALAQQAGLHRPLVPLRRATLRSRPHFLATDNHPWCWLDDVGVYVRPDAGKWLCSPCDEVPDWPPLGPGSTGSATKAQQELLGCRLARYIPALSGLGFQHNWTGLRTFAPDRRPLIGADPELDGLWWAAGLGGFGVSCSYGVGEVLAAWMHGQSTPWLRPAAVNPGRPQASRWLIRPSGDLHKARLAEVEPKN